MLGVMLFSSVESLLNSLCFRTGRTKLFIAALLLMVSPLRAAVVDNFGDGTVSSHWKTANYPQYDSLGDGLSLSESQDPGLLRATYDDVQGSAQITLMLRDDIQLAQVNDYVQVKLRIAAGAASLNVGPGICLATQATGINQNRANSVWYALRNDGLARANAYGTGGVEFSDPSMGIPGYQSGNWVTLRITRTASSIISFSFLDSIAGWVTVGTADFTGYTLPTIPGLMFGNGLADYTVQFDDFTVGNTATEPTPTPTPSLREIALTVPTNLLTLPTIPSTRHQVNFPTGQGDYTYHHGALITWWKGNFYTSWTSTPASECTTPYKGMLSRSLDGQTWGTPVKVGSVAEDAAYAAYMRNRYNLPSGALEINVAPRCFHATTDKLYLWTLAWIVTSSGREYVGRAFVTTDGNTWTEIAPQVLDNYENNQGLGSVRDTASNHSFFKLNDGRLMAFNLGGGPRYPTTTDPTGLTQWVGGYVLPGACGDVGEPGGYQGPDGVLHGTARCTTGDVWHAYSENGGQTWTPLIRQTNFTDSPGNKDWGRLPDSSIYYVGNPKTGSRQQLVLGISRDGWLFNENYLIRGEAITPIWYSTCKSEDRPGWEYPSAVYHNGYLYVAYSRTRDFIEVSKVNMAGVIRPSTSVKSWPYYGIYNDSDSGEAKGR